MVLFKRFGTKPKEEVETIPVVPVEAQNNGSDEDVSSTDAKKDDDKRVITITWGTGMPIDVLFNFIHKNFEEEGFQDALVNSDIAYRDAKEKIICYDLEMLFKRIILRYKKDIREIDCKIDNSRRAFAFAAADQLQARRETFEEHLSEINEMQTQLNDNDPKMLTMIESYRRGFQKGMAAVAINFIENK